MWNRLDETIHTQKRGTIFWKIAAVFMALLLVAGVYAAYNYLEKQQENIEKLQKNEIVLKNTIDSLLNRPVETQIQTKRVEKIVYVKRPPVYEKKIDK